MRNYASSAQLQVVACHLISWLYDSASSLSDNALATGDEAVDLVLAAATHAADEKLACEVCLALFRLSFRGDWARRAVKGCSAKTVLALMAAHAGNVGLQSHGAGLLGLMVKADWQAMQADAGSILAAMMRSLAHNSGPLHQNCTNFLVALYILLTMDPALASQAIAAGAFDLTIKEMIAAPDNHMIQRNGCLLLWRLADSPSISAVPREQLIPALDAVVASLGLHKSNMLLQVHGCAALAALQPLVRRHVCTVVETALAAFPDNVNKETAGNLIRTNQPDA